MPAGRIQEKMDGLGVWGLPRVMIDKRAPADNRFQGRVIFPGIGEIDVIGSSIVCGSMK